MILFHGTALYVFYILLRFTQQKTTHMLCRILSSCSGPTGGSTGCIMRILSRQSGCGQLKHQRCGPGQGKGLLKIGIGVVSIESNLSFKTRCKSDSFSLARRAELTTSAYEILTHSFYGASAKSEKQIRRRRTRGLIRFCTVFLQNVLKMKMKFTTQQPLHS